MKIHNFLSYLIQSRPHGVAIHIMRYVDMYLGIFYSSSLFIEKIRRIDIYLLGILLMINQNRRCPMWNFYVIFANRLLNE